MLLPFSPYSTSNSGFHLEVEFEESSNLFTVVNIRWMGLFELSAFSFAFIVGLIILARVAKSFLGDYEYFKALDWEATMLFGDTGVNLEVDKKFERETSALEER